MTSFVTVVPWFNMPITDPEAARLWPVLTAIQANLPAVTLCLGLTKAMLRSVRTIACTFPVAVVHQQMQIGVPFIAALFLWPVFSTANHLMQDIFLLYGFQLRVFTPCIMAFWAITFQRKQVSSAQRRFEMKAKMAREEAETKSRASVASASRGSLSRLSVSRLSIFNSPSQLVARSTRTSVEMEKITYSFNRDNVLTDRITTIQKIVGKISSALIAFGCYRVAAQQGMVESGFQMLLDMALPTAFLAVSDMLFMELVATDLVMKCLVSLRIFNGFMQTDEDLHALLIVVGLEGLTGRGLMTPESIKKEISSPLQSSKTRMTIGAGTTSTDTEIMNEVEGGVLRELNGLKKQKKALREKNAELKQRLERMGLMKNGKFVEQEEETTPIESAGENGAPAFGEKPADTKEVHFSF
jgi:hypothetical protein